jgi:transposase
MLLSLLPTLYVLLLMDNARIHHTAIVEQLLQDMDTDYIYLPPYSPDYNPIELVFGWIKRYIKSREVTNILDMLHEAINALDVDTINSFITVKEIGCLINFKFNNLATYSRTMSLDLYTIVCLIICASPRRIHDINELLDVIED